MVRAGVGDGRGGGEVTYIAKRPACSVANTRALTTVFGTVELVRMGYSNQLRG
jgi:hypothetical protein